MPKLDFKEYEKEWEAGKLLRPLLFFHTMDSQIYEVVTEMKKLVS